MQEGFRTLQWEMQQVTLWPWKTFSANVIDAGDGWLNMGVGLRST
jgi:hypothetical protein